MVFLLNTLDIALKNMRSQAIKLHERIIMTTKKSTDELMKQLSSTSNIDSYLSNNSDNLINSTFIDKLEERMEQHQLSKAQVLKNADINQIYGYQIFAGQKKPSRDKILALCTGAQLSVDETNEILKIAGEAALYPKNKRDSIIIQVV